MPRVEPGRGQSFAHQFGRFSGQVAEALVVDPGLRRAVEHSCKVRSNAHRRLVDRRRARPLVALAGCSSSGGKQAKVTGRAEASVTTTTQPDAIGLRTNADEQAELGPDKPLTAAQRQALGVQLVAARAAAEKYPTVADALRGRTRPGRDCSRPARARTTCRSPAAISGVRGNHGRLEPPARRWIYDGVSPTSRVVGLMYASFANNPPAGFSGPNDHWHRHTNLCITYGTGKIEIPFAPDSNVKKSQCDALHGQFMRRTLLDGARVGGARVGQPPGRVLAREHRSALRRRHRQHRCRRFLQGNVSSGRTVSVRVRHATPAADILHFFQEKRRLRRSHSGS